jgi:hypothetical protein
MMFLLKFRIVIGLNVKRILSLCALGLIASTGSTQVSAQIRNNLSALVPPTAVAVVRINWTIIRQDNYFRAMLNADRLDIALSQLKIGGNDISEIVVFSGIDGSSTGVVAGIFRGTYSAPRILAQLRSKGLSEQGYRSRTIYFDAKDQSCVTILRSGMLVIGSQKGVQGVIDVEMNPRLGITSRPPYSSFLKRFNVSRRPISFVMALPLEYQTVADVGVKVVSTLFSFSGLGPLGYVIDKIGFPQALGFSIERNGANFPTELIAKMKDPTSAALISGTFNLVQSINLHMMSDRMSPADREMLKNISLSRDDTMLTVKMVLHEQDLPHPVLK